MVRPVTYVPLASLYYHTVWNVALIDVMRGHDWTITTGKVKQACIVDEIPDHLTMCIDYSSSNTIVPYCMKTCLCSKYVSSKLVSGQKM